MTHTHVRSAEKPLVTGLNAYPLGLLTTRCGGRARP